MEYLSFKKLRGVYEQFLASFPTTLAQDLALLRGQERKNLSVRQYFGVVYRSEQKRILINQIKLVNIVSHILERLMKGMTLDFAVTRVFEHETKQDVIPNRKMLDNYLASLRRGLERNRVEYLKCEGLTEATMQQQHAHKRFVEYASSAELRRFEMKGYETMLARLLDAPL